MDEQTLRKIQLEELDMFKEIVKICERHGLTYYVMGGTLLGAVRHQGFIPWDDDLDIGFYRDEYDRFLQYAEQELPSPLRLISMYNDKDYIHIFSRVIDNRVKLRRDNTVDRTVQSLWVDIFPIDGVPEGRIARFAWEKTIYVLRGLRNLSCFRYLIDVQKEYKGLKKVIVNLGLKTNVEKLLSTRLLLKVLDRFLRHWDPRSCNMIGNPMGGAWFKEVYPKACYEPSIRLPFEDTEVNCPAGYDLIMTQMYGDYMTPLPEGQRNKHGTSLVSFDK